MLVSGRVHPTIYLGVQDDPSYLTLLRKILLQALQMYE